MDYASEKLIELGVSLTGLAVKETASTVQKKISSAKAKRDDKKVIETYDEIVNELIEERAEAIRIAQSYKYELDKYEISDKDIEHLNNTISTVLDILKEMSPEMDIEVFKKIKELITVDTLKSMQLLGFNYKKAIGEPLTELCSNKILNVGKTANNKKK
jgi:hypothetical protein